MGPINGGGRLMTAAFVMKESHGSLLFSESDVHLFKSKFVQRSGNLQPFRLLIFP